VRAAVLTTIALLVCVAPALAEESEARKQARAHFRAGTAFFEVGAYDQAIEQYEMAYQLLPAPDLLFNLAQAYRLKGDDTAAMAQYRRYLASVSTGPVADEARAHLRELAAKHPPSPPPTVTSPPPTTTSPLPTTTSLPPTTTSPPPTTTSPPTATEHAPIAEAPPTTPSLRTSPGERPRTRRWVWGVVAGSAAVVIAVGVGLGVGLGSGTRYPSTTFGEVMPR
jgi:hypothetical protein